MMGSKAGGSPGAGRAQDAPEGPSPQDLSIAAAGGDGIPTLDTITAAEAVTSLATSEVDAGDPAASTGPAADALSSPPQMAATTASAGINKNVVDEPKVIMGHPSLSAPGVVSHIEALGTTYFALNQAHDVLRREREDINEEWLLLSVWVSLLK
jgi:hypothetical protein